MVSVFLAILSSDGLEGDNFQDFIARLYKAFQHGGCRIVLGTPNGVGMTGEAPELPPLANAFRFPVDLAEVDERHLAHYDIVCVIQGEGEHKQIYCTPKVENAADLFGAPDVAEINVGKAMRRVDAKADEGSLMNMVQEFREFAVADRKKTGT
ncbi:MAG: hypothetical protein GC134_09810 [Proteobacteria bacterium]|nr:hypothetical protein [Pseudomonadota bacterium]